MSTYPQITLTLEGMRTSIVHALVAQQQEIADAVDAEITAYIKNFDFKSFLKKEMDEIVRATLQEAMKRSVQKALWSQEVKSILETNVLEALQKALKEFYPWANPPEGM